MIAHASNALLFQIASVRPISRSFVNLIIHGCLLLDESQTKMSGLLQEILDVSNIRKHPDASLRRLIMLTLLSIYNR